MLDIGTNKTSERDAFLFLGKDTKIMDSRGLLNEKIKAKPIYQAKLNS